MDSLNTRHARAATVGYGEIVPASALSRIVVLCFVFFFLCTIPYQIGALYARLDPGTVPLASISNPIPLLLYTYTHRQADGGDLVPLHVPHQQLPTAARHGAHRRLGARHLPRFSEVKKGHALYDPVWLASRTSE